MKNGPEKLPLGFILLNRWELQEHEPDESNSRDRKLMTLFLKTEGAKKTRTVILQTASCGRFADDTMGRRARFRVSANMDAAASNDGSTNPLNPS